MDSVRTDPAFGELFAQTWDLLRDEVTTARRRQEEALVR